MANLFDIDNRFFRYVAKLTDLVLLNILWVIFSIPIITMGAATSAVYYVTLKMVKDEEGYIIRSFWKGFKQNLKQGIIIEVILLISGIILLGDIRYFLVSKNIFSYLFISIFVIGLIIYTFTLIFVFPIIAKFNNTVSETLRNAVVISLNNPLVSISMTVLLIVMLYGFYVSVPIMVIFPLIAVSGYAYIGSILFRDIFERCKIKNTVRD